MPITLPGGFSALSLKLDATRHPLFITTLNIHTLGPQLQHSTTATQSILNLTHGGSWARCQLSSGIRFIPRGLLFMKLQDSRGEMLVIPELDSRFLHNHYSDPGSVYGRLLGSTPATQQYKGCLCHIRTQEIADPFESCLYRYPGNLRTRWQIPPRPPVRSWIRLREIVGLDASYAAV